MKELKIREDFKDLIPPISQSTFNILEQDILEHGIMSPILTWGGVIVDGHNRYEIAKKHNLDFEIKEIEGLYTENDVKKWMLQNQSTRRNVNCFTKAELAIKYLNLIKEKNDNKEITYKSDIIKKVFGLSIETVYRVDYILKYGTENQIKAARDEEGSILNIWSKINSAKKRSLRSELKFKDLDIGAEYTCTDCWEFMKREDLQRKINLVITEPVQPSDDELYNRFKSDERLKKGFALSIFEKALMYMNDFTKPACDYFFVINPDYLYSYLKRIEESGLNIRHLLVWDFLKPKVSSNPKKLQKRYNMIIWAYKGSERPLTKIIPDVIEEKYDVKNPQDTLPKNVVKKLIELVEDQYTYVFDPFAGRASVLRAALEMRVKSMGCEYDADIYNEGVDLFEKERGESL